VTVVILHVNKYIKKKVTRKFKSGGLHEKQVDDKNENKKIGLEKDSGDQLFRSLSLEID